MEYLPGFHICILLLWFLYLSIFLLAWTLRLQYQYSKYSFLPLPQFYYFLTILTEFKIWRRKQLKAYLKPKKCSIREALNLLMCADKSTDTKTDRKGKEKNIDIYVMCQMSGVRCHLSLVTCCVLPVTCHLPLMPTATATIPPTANSPTIHSRLVRKDTGTQ